MAQSTKSRSNRRSSSTSYASTLTTLVFIALCVLGVWMLSSNSVVSSKTRSNNESTNTRTSIDNSATTNDFSSTDQDTAETTTTTTNNNNNNNNSDDQSSETTTSDQESSDQTTTKSQDKKDSTTTTVYGDNPGQLPDDAIKNDDSNSNNVEPQKQQAASLTNEEGSDNNNDQKTTESEKVLQQISTSSTDRTSELEENIATAQDRENSKQNTESQNAAINELGENLQEQSTGGGGGGEQDVRSFDTTQGSNKNKEVDHEQQRVRENNKGGEIEVTVNEQKQEQKENQKVQLDERHEITQKPKQEEKKRRKSSKSSSSSSKKKKESKKSWSTQADESEGEKERQKEEEEEEEEEESGGNINEEVQEDLEWHLCNVTAGADYIPCLDNEKYLRTSHRKHYEHRERHCPEDAPTCLVLLPKGYKTRVQWPNSRDKIWYHNVPHTKLAEVKGHQNWVKLTGEFLTFPGGGTQFIHGALHYIDFLQQAEPDIAWGKHTRVILDVGCGVGSFGGFLFERDVIAMSFAPKDEHEAQVQFALERGIPAISAVMGTQRLQFPSRAFDLVHCARCRVPWHEDGGLLLLELNRVLRPGGFFVWSATPVYQTLEEDVEIWKQMTSLTKAMCWELVTTKKDALNQVGAAFYRKPTSNECYEQREKNEPPMCKDDDDPNDAWYVPLQACMHRLHADKAERGAKWPEAWPLRLQKAPYWLNNSQKGIYGKPAPQDFAADTERWKNVVDELSNIGISWSNVRNVMDMQAVYGGFAAALKDLPLWVFNVVNTDSPDTLPIIFERGLIGIYHDWCESFNTYPRTYDLLHADHLFSKLKNRCKLVPVIAEVDRIVRPGGILIVRDESNAISEVEILLKSLHWEITSKNKEGVLCAKKGNWRPNTFVTLY